MADQHLEVFDSTVQKTHEWLGAIGSFTLLISAARIST